MVLAGPMATPNVSVTTTATKSAPAVAVAVVAPFPSTTPPRKLVQLLASSAPSRIGSVDPRRQVELSRSGWRSSLWPSSPVFRKKLSLSTASNQSPAKLSASTSSNNNKSDNKVERELAGSALFTRTLRVAPSEPQDDDEDDRDCSARAQTASAPTPSANTSTSTSREFSKLAHKSAATLHSLKTLEAAVPVISVRLHGGDLHVQSAQQHAVPVKAVTLEVATPATTVATAVAVTTSRDSSIGHAASPAAPLSPQARAKRQSLEQELDEFRTNADAQIVMFPDYFADDDKELVKRVAEALRLGCQIGERNVAVFKTGESCDKVWPRVRSRSSVTAIGGSSSSDSSAAATSDDVFVNVSELAQQGKDCFIARLRLRRLSSGSGVRRNMLWDVAELTQRDGIADPVSEGDGGVYAVQSRASGQKLAMFKPAEEEKFVRDGLVPGEGAVREEAAYVLDSRSNGFSGVPPTAVARLQLSNLGRAKQGAVQRFMMSSIGSMEGFGMPFDLAKAEAFVPVEQVHRIALLDVRVFNTDRHPGNILLIGDRAPYTMAPIDHGCILPSWFHLSEARFDWLEYPQCKVPFAAAAVEYIAALDADADAHALRKLGIREECVTTLKICTLFLQRAARAGRSLYWIGSFMQRSGCFETPSELELLVQQACVASDIPFTFVPNAFGEQKGSIEPGVLSRRPPQQFFDALGGLVDRAVAQ